MALGGELTPFGILGCSGLVEHFAMLASKMLASKECISVLLGCRKEVQTPGIRHQN